MLNVRYQTGYNLGRKLHLYTTSFALFWHPQPAGAPEELPQTESYEAGPAACQPCGDPPSSKERKPTVAMAWCHQQASESEDILTSCDRFPNYHSPIRAAFRLPGIRVGVPQTSQQVRRPSLGPLRQDGILNLEAEILSCGDESGLLVLGAGGGRSLAHDERFQVTPAKATLSPRLETQRAGAKACRLWL